MMFQSRFTTIPISQLLNVSEVPPSLPSMKLLAFGSFFLCTDLFIGLDTIVVSWDSFPSLWTLVKSKNNLEINHESHSFPLESFEVTRNNNESHASEQVDCSSMPQQAAVLQSIKNIVLLPPYPCLNPIHLAVDEKLEPSYSNSFTRVSSSLGMLQTPDADTKSGIFPLQVQDRVPVQSTKRSLAYSLINVRYHS